LTTFQNDTVTHYKQKTSGKTTHGTKDTK
jgi:hypothetical protein